MLKDLRLEPTPSVAIPTLRFGWLTLICDHSCDLSSVVISILLSTFNDMTRNASRRMTLFYKIIQSFRLSWSQCELNSRFWHPSWYQLTKITEVNTYPMAMWSTTLETTGRTAKGRLLFVKNGQYYLSQITNLKEWVARLICYLWSLLLTWFNSNPTTDKSLHAW